MPTELNAGMLKSHCKAHVTPPGPALIIVVQVVGRGVGELAKRAIEKCRLAAIGPGSDDGFCRRIGETGVRDDLICFIEETTQAAKLNGAEIGLSPQSEVRILEEMKGQRPS